MLRQSARHLLARFSGIPNVISLESGAMALAGSRFASAASPAYVEHAMDHNDDSTKTFRASDIEYTLQPTQPVLNLKGVKFGTLFTDHMFLAQHSDQGWERPQIKPFGALPLHPAAQVLHYGMTCFEGMKAYKGPDGKPLLFRPEMNMNRLHKSATRLMLADFDPHELLESIKELIKVDKAWLPSNYGESLYIRPFMFSSSSVLGVAQARNTTLSVILSPVGPYFPTGPKPISLFMDETTPRAWPGGVGAYKIGGNYAPTIAPQVHAQQAYGASQVVYTENSEETKHDPDSAHIDECGAMNVFFFLQLPDGSRELVTPPLAGTILPGVTRDSILTLAREWGEFKVSERKITIREIKKAALEGRLIEVFGSGTACIVSSVSTLLRANGDVYVTRTDESKAGSLTGRIEKALMDIQYGIVDHSWSMPVE